MVTIEELAKDQAEHFPFRQETTCRGCGQPKEVGLLVCWTCFKYRKDNPFKYWKGTLRTWLAAIGRA